MGHLEGVHNYTIYILIIIIGRRAAAGSAAARPGLRPDLAAAESYALRASQSTFWDQAAPTARLAASQTPRNEFANLFTSTMYTMYCKFDQLVIFHFASLT